ACREAEEDVDVYADLTERASIGRLGVTRLFLVHEHGAPTEYDAFDIGDPDVAASHAETNQQIEASERCGARAAANELHCRRVLADHLQPVHQCGADDDRGSMLVVMEHRDLHPLAQLALDVEALGRLDVFEIDATERWLERG